MTDDANRETCATPLTEEPAAKKICTEPTGVCARCNKAHPFGRQHCSIVALPMPFNAKHPGSCILCKKAFVIAAPGVKSTVCVYFFELGAACRECAVNALEPYTHANLDLPLVQRIDKACDDVPVPIRDALRNWNGSEYAGATLHLVEAQPGSGKSLLLCKNALVNGPRHGVNLVFNAIAADDLRKRGAFNALTLNSNGQRSLRRALLFTIQEKRRRGQYTYEEAPPGTAPALFKLGKPEALLAVLRPPTAADGVTRLSLTVLTYGEFVGRLYSLARQASFGVTFLEPAVTRPGMDDVAALMALAIQFKLDVRYLEVGVSLLTPEQLVRMRAEWPTPEHRLAFGCALISDIHQAALATATSPRWTLPDGSRVGHLTSVCGRVTERLPVNDYDEQITLPLHLPEQISSAGYAYHQINLDEAQDCSDAKLLMLIKMKRDSDQRGGPGHNTLIRAVGDTDQTIHGFTGAQNDVFTRVEAIVRALYPDAVVGRSFLDYTLRVPPVLAKYATAQHKAGRQSLGLPVDEAKLPMRTLPGAAEGEIFNEGTFVRFPFEQYYSPAEAKNVTAVGILGRRQLECKTTSAMLTVRCIPHTSTAGDATFTPREVFLRALEKLRSGTRQRPALKTAAEVLQVLPEEGLPTIANSVVAKGLREFVRTRPATVVSIVELINHASAHFSVAACKRIEIATAHSVKGATYWAVYLLQPSLFPLDRAVEEGGISLEQEPNVEYVANTRPCNTLILMKNAQLAGEDASLETIYYELE
jgi:hypothetical protein